jgi:hypothetical protein
MSFSGTITRWIAETPLERCADSAFMSLMGHALYGAVAAEVFERLEAG